MYRSILEKNTEKYLHGPVYVNVYMYRSIALLDLRAHAHLSDIFIRKCLPIHLLCCNLRKGPTCIPRAGKRGLSSKMSFHA